jgi:hypothetical protein
LLRGSGFVGRREEIGRAELSGMGRLERVERRRRVEELLADSGRRLSSSSKRVEIGVVGGRASKRVGGRPVPAKVVMRTLILLEAMLLVPQVMYVMWCLGRVAIAGDGDQMG